MPQTTYFINCPHCGEVIEVVCPRIDANPREVKADPKYTIRFSSFNNEIACPKCRQYIMLHWYLSIG